MVEGLRRVKMSKMCLKCGQKTKSYRLRVSLTAIDDASSTEDTGHSASKKNDVTVTCDQSRRVTREFDARDT